MFSFLGFCVAAVAVISVSAGECDVYCSEAPKQEVCCERFYLNVNRDPSIVINASSSWDANHGPHRAALFEVVEGNEISGWAAGSNDVNQWIEVDFGSPHYVTGLLLQGRGHSRHAQWVTSFRVLYSNDREVFYSTETMEGSLDRDTVATRFFNRPILARYCRINPLAWQRHITLRFDLLGCKA